jgi:hypothetical protein
MVFSKATVISVNLFCKYAIIATVMLLVLSIYLNIVWVFIATNDKFYAILAYSILSSLHRFSMLSAPSSLASWIELCSTFQA